MKRLTVLASISALITVLAVCSDSISDGVKNGLSLAVNGLIPSIYIFCILSFFCTESKCFEKTVAEKLIGYIFGVSDKYAVTVLLSLIAGYPTSALLLNKMTENDNINPKEAERIILFTVSASPGFCIAFIGNYVYGNKEIGVIIYIANILSSIATSLFKRKKTIYTKIGNRGYINYSSVLINSVKSANTSIIMITSWVVISAVISQLSQDLLKTKIPAMFIEITCAVQSAKEISVYAVAFLVGFGGFSVILQVISAVEFIKLNIIKLTLSQIIRGMTTSLFAFLLIKIFKISEFTSNFKLEYSYFGNSPYKTIILLCFIIITMIFFEEKSKFCRKNKNNVLK